MVKMLIMGKSYKEYLKFKNQYYYNFCLICPCFNNKKITDVNFIKVYYKQKPVDKLNA